MPPALLGLIAALAAGLVVWATQPLPGVTVDSAEYLAVAEGLVAGEGFTMPYLNYDEPYRVPAPGERVAMTQFPPLYPTVLAGVELLAPGGVLDAARIVGVILMGAVAGGGTWVIARETEQMWPALIAAGLLLAPDVITLHGMAWSEPLAVLALIGAVHFTTRYLRSGRRIDMALAFSLGAVASLARFAGIAFIAATALAVLIYGRDRLIKRAMVVVLGASTASVPVALWFLRNVRVAGEVSEKDVAWHPPGTKQLLQAVEAIGAWALPGPVLPLAGGFLIVGLALVFAFRRRGRPPSDGRAMPKVCVVFFAVYALFVIATRTLLDQNVSMDLRILAPLHVMLVLAVGSKLPIPSRSHLRAPLIAALVALSVITVGRGVFLSARFSGISVTAYTGDGWRDSETLRAAGALEPDVPIVTNAPDPLWLWHDRLPLLVPPRSNRYSGEPNYDYLNQVAQLRSRLGCEGVVVWFDQPTRKPPRIIDPVLAAGLQVERVQDLADGEIYAVSLPTSSSWTSACR